MGASEPTIPFNRPYFAGTEFNHVREAIANMHFSGCGPFTRKYESALQAILGDCRVLLTTPAHMH